MSNFCSGISWPIVDNLLFHYASHHNVLEKVVMYESEIASREMRDSLKAKEDTIQSLTRELEELKGGIITLSKAFNGVGRKEGQ